MNKTLFISWMPCQLFYFCSTVFFRIILVTHQWGTRWVHNFHACILLFISRHKKQFWRHFIFYYCALFMYIDLDYGFNSAAHTCCGQPVLPLLFLLVLSALLLELVLLAGLLLHFAVVFSESCNIKLWHISRNSKCCHAPVYYCRDALCQKIYQIKFSSTSFY